MAPSFCVRLALSRAIVVGLLLFWQLPAAAEELEYSNIDLATVRVFALHGIDVVQVPTRRGGHYNVATPLAGHGSGIKVNREGLVLTAAHVVEGHRRVVVKIPKSDKAYPGLVVYRNEKRDFAFVVIPGFHKHFVPMPESAPELRVRQTVDAIGYPWDSARERPQSTRGIVSGLMPDGRLQLGISVNPGNSGGPLVDEQENLVGIVVARGDVEMGVQGIGVAVPMDRIVTAAKRVLRDDGPHAKARAKLENVSDGDWAHANLIAELVQTGGAVGMLQEVSESLEGGQKKKAVTRALKQALEHVQKQRALVLSLASAYYWNAAVVLRHKRRKWSASLDRALDLGKQAYLLDHRVVGRSPYVKYVRLVASRRP